MMIKKYSKLYNNSLNLLKFDVQRRENLTPVFTEFVASCRSYRNMFLHGEQSKGILQQQNYGIFVENFDNEQRIASYKFVSSCYLNKIKNHYKDYPRDWVIARRNVSNNEDVFPNEFVNCDFITHRLTFGNNNEKAVNGRRVKMIYNYIVDLTRMGIDDVANEHSCLQFGICKIFSKRNSRYSFKKTHINTFYLDLLNTSAIGNLLLMNEQLYCNILHHNVSDYLKLVVDVDDDFDKCKRVVNHIIILPKTAKVLSCL